MISCKRLFPRFAREKIAVVSGRTSVVLIKLLVKSLRTATSPLHPKWNFANEMSLARCHFRPSISANGAGKRCVTVTENMHTSTRADEFSRKSRVNDLVCSARMCNKIELAIDPGEEARGSQGKKKRLGRMRYLSDGAIVTSSRRDN